MEISIHNAAKRYLHDWIFRNLSLHVGHGERIVVLGPNGSGKSTLLQVISGQLTLTEGEIQYTCSSGKIAVDSVFRKLSYSAPYLELIEEFSLIECIEFHCKFKVMVNGFSPEDVLKISGLEKSRDKVLRNFSSGMKQRLKLTLAILSDVELLLLDEPCSNLDSDAIAWYHGMINKFASNRNIVVCSNNLEYEYSYCSRSLNILQWK
ncbi:MAG: ABC transporter ATP-binding protein [Bacteroidetes bacterium]|nr:MAG: ABC transporter ATP-binding protein [Bacteroidota bacterium]REK08010.1 MAG: ABC transporter ATP-binding protein [Bacteroidota bacterium]REK32215.1 MAG: ABC transporter ATP-binding protein [Bacteroidota bacterium]REK47367.1 MAG: ABC transporter ATP-binding protein [Bacteroidota bacterium]